MGAAGGLLGMALYFAMTPAGHFLEQPYPYPAWYSTWGHTWTAVLGSLLILVAVQPGTWVYGVMRLRPLRWIGRLTYGAYVFHDVPHRFYAHLARQVAPAHPMATTAVIAMTGTLAISWASFRLLESPFLNLKERWTRRA